MKPMTTLIFLLSLLLMTGCATPPAEMDYEAFKANQPRSILILPPLNESPEVEATYSTLSQMTLPLAEAGYYVLPVALTAETFRQNGMTVPHDIHQLSPAKLHDIFGADAALYVTVKDYGSRYQVIRSAAVVVVVATLVDLRSGTTLWTGGAGAASDENRQNNQGGLLGMVISAAINQIIDTATDKSHDVAGIASARLLSPNRRNGILYGPRSPMYATD